VRLYLDEDVRGQAKILATLRNDLTYPGDGVRRVPRIRPSDR